MWLKYTQIIDIVMNYVGQLKIHHYIVCLPWITAKSQQKDRSETQSDTMSNKGTRSAALGGNLRESAIDLNNPPIPEEGDNAQQTADTACTYKQPFFPYICLWQIIF